MNLLPSAIRLLLFAVQGFFHAMSSAQVRLRILSREIDLQELMLSIERAVSSASPEEYHTRRLSKRALFLAEFISVMYIINETKFLFLQVAIATLYSWIISKSANPGNQFYSCCLFEKRLFQTMLHSLAA